jgi:predicted nucleic acid-binding Zn ribbon protein
MNKKNCPECSSVVTGRSDKKFCSELCKTTFNNRIKRISNFEIEETNRLLRKNRSILKKLGYSGKTVVRKETLLTLEYNFSFFTSFFITAEKTIYYLCYDYGFMAIKQNGKEKALIISKQEYMNGIDPWKYVKES